MSSVICIKVGLTNQKKTHKGSELIQRLFCSDFNEVTRHFISFIWKLKDGLKTFQDQVHKNVILKYRWSVNSVDSRIYTEQISINRIIPLEKWLFKAWDVEVYKNLWYSWQVTRRKGLTSLIDVPWSKLT